MHIQVYVYMCIYTYVNKQIHKCMYPYNCTDKYIHIAGNIKSLYVCTYTTL